MSSEELPFVPRSANRELLKIVILARHGARAPKTLPPKLEHHLDLWEDRLGHLTHFGKSQKHALGCFIRQKYGNMLGLECNIDVEIT
jgi:hypothetical protein